MAAQLRIDVLEEIGRGGCGVVHRARLHERAGPREVAVKLLGAGASLKQQEAFIVEVKKSQIIGARCTGVVTIYGAMLRDGQTMLVMKLYKGSLADKLEAAGALPLATALRYGRQALRALKSLHEHGGAALDGPRPPSGG